MSNRNLSRIYKESLDKVCSANAIQQDVVNLEFSPRLIKQINENFIKQQGHIKRLLFSICPIDHRRANATNDPLELSKMLTHNWQVALFLRKALILIINSSQVGGEKNMKLILNYVKLYSGMSYRSYLSLSSLTRLLQVSSQYDRKLCLCHLSALCYTIVQGIVGKLIQMYFHVSDNSNKKTVIYHTRTIWRLILKNKEKKFLDDGFLKKLRKDSIQSEMKSSMGVGCLRLILKSDLSKLRPICLYPKLFVFKDPENNETSLPGVNVQLKAKNHLKDFLNRARSQIPLLFGCRQSNNLNLWDFLRDFKKKMNNSGICKFFVYKLDVTCFYDSIDHAKLLFVFKVLLDKAVKFVFPKPNREEVMTNFNRCINDIILEMNGKYYRQARGIPQGLCISGDLGDLYLASCDRKSYLKTFTIHDSIRECDNTKQYELLIRHHDDYLYISTSPSTFDNFIQSKTNELKEYSLSLNMKKLESSSDTDCVTWFGCRLSGELTIEVPLLRSFPENRSLYSGLPDTLPGLLQYFGKYLMKFPKIQRAFHPDWISHSRSADNAHRFGQLVGHRVRSVIRPYIPSETLFKEPCLTGLVVLIRRHIRRIVLLPAYQRQAENGFIDYLRPYKGQFVNYIRKLIYLQNTGK